MSKELITAFGDLKCDDVLKQLKDDIERGEDPLKILEECRRGMEIVGERYQRGEYFLAELALSADIFKQATDILKPNMDRQRISQNQGKVVLATLKGDIHDLGKNILATLLSAHGFDVYDLGVNVNPSLVVDKVKEINPQFVGFSALLTTTYDTMKEASELFNHDGLRNKFSLMIGGAMTNSTVKEYVGADFQTQDAMEGVAYCIKMAKER